ncbi:MAG: branched-chain amino acid ABC transporter permease, partial [Burkholderiales bacterium]
MMKPTKNNYSFAITIVVALAATAYLVVLMYTEAQSRVLLLLAGGVIAALAAIKSGLLARLNGGETSQGNRLEALAIICVLLFAACCYDQHFSLLMLATVLLIAAACLGLTLQMGFAGVVNFAGAAFFGVGSYAAAVLTQHTALPHLLIPIV